MGRGKDLALLTNEEEVFILKLLREFPQIIEQAASSLEPQGLISYLIDLASAFHLFYAKHRVVCEDVKLTAARLALVESLKIVFSKSLALLGVSCPERM